MTLNQRGGHNIKGFTFIFYDVTPDRKIASPFLSLPDHTTGQRGDLGNRKYYKVLFTYFFDISRGI